MPSLFETQAGFADALLNGEERVPAGLKSPHRAAPAKRFNVYRNNVYSNLIGILEDRFPAVLRLVGEEFFRAMARAFIDRHPPTSPVLMRYGGELAEFIEGFEPVAELPYLADVARLEWVWSQAYHAQDAAPIDARALQKVAPDEAEGLTFVLHPSLGIVRSPWPVVTIWSANMQEGEPDPIDLGSGGEDALILRPALEVLVHRLPPGGATFVAALREGGSLGEAASASLLETEEFDLQGNLTALLQCGAITALAGGAASATASAT